MTDFQNRAVPFIYLLARVPLRGGPRGRVPMGPGSRGTLRGQAAVGSEPGALSYSGPGSRRFPFLKFGDLELGMLKT